MSEEKQTDSFNWKDKLDALDSLPDEPFTHKNAAWDTLHNRLQEKPRRKIAVWYWAAAACLLIALFIPRAIVQKKDNALVTTPAKEAINQTAPVPHPTLTHTDTIAVSPIVSIEKNQSIKNNNNPTLHTNKHTGKNEMAKKETNNIISEPPEPVIATLTNITTQPDTVATVVVAKKKLRVVHLNELEPAPAASIEQVAVSAPAQFHHFKIRLANIQPFNKTTATRREYATVKIPLTN